MAQIAPGWRVLQLCTTSTAIGFGLWGRRRTEFSNDFSYNKFHFGVYTSLFATYGIHLALRQPIPLTLNSMFIAAISLNSVPAYIEGFQDMSNNDVETQRFNLARKVGFYSLLLGWTLLILSWRGKLTNMPLYHLLR